MYIYVLKLEGGKYYVGKTENPEFRLEKHFNTKGSAWTKKYKPISIYELKPDKQGIDEQIVTQEYMVKFGIDNVRGGPWCKISLTESEKKLIDHINKSNLDSCYKCGDNGHFSSNCPQSKSTTKTKTKTKQEGWNCSYCNKLFDSKKGATFHENVYCKKKNKLKDESDDSSYCSDDWDSEQDNDYKFKKNNCSRCGRKGHLRSRCYASSHIKGYSFD